jgi:predicted GIY-YIG superfamily endonuclease
MYEMETNWYTYLLVCDNKTYVGMTNNLDRRLRQHNGELAGGARATHGRSWERVCHVRGFRTKVEALKFEWRWKYFTRRSTEIKDFQERRWVALEKCMAFYSNEIPGLEVVFA